MNLTNLIYNVKLGIRTQLGKNALWVTSRKDLTIQKDSDLCVEGFPRSANTYSVLLIEKFARKPLKIAHHLHIPSQIKQARAWNIPAILLIREPTAAIPSLVLREKGISLWNAINWYNSFHSELTDLKDYMEVWRFDELTKHPLDCLRNLNSRLDLLDINDDLANMDNEEIFSEIDQLDRETKTGRDLGLVNSRPNAKKNPAKQEILDQMMQNQRHRKNLERAKELYHFFTH